MMKTIKGNDLIIEADDFSLHKVAFYERSLEGKIVLDIEELREKQRHVFSNETYRFIDDILEES